jgi:hypothetical protein
MLVHHSLGMRQAEQQAMSCNQRQMLHAHKRRQMPHACRTAAAREKHPRLRAIRDLHRLLHTASSHRASRSLLLGAQLLGMHSSVPMECAAKELAAVSQRGHTRG